MKVALIPLAFGTLTTWLLAGPFASLLHGSLPFHEIETLPTLAVLEEVVIRPDDLDRPDRHCPRPGGLVAARAVGRVERGPAGHRQSRPNSFGFEAINRGVVQFTPIARKRCATRKPAI